MYRSANIPMPDTDEQDEPIPCNALAKNRIQYERPNANTGINSRKSNKWYSQLLLHHALIYGLRDSLTIRRNFSESVCGFDERLKMRLNQI